MVVVVVVVVVLVVVVVVLVVVGRCCCCCFSFHVLPSVQKDCSSKPLANSPQANRRGSRIFSAQNGIQKRGKPLGSLMFRDHP